MLSGRIPANILIQSQVWNLNLHLYGSSVLLSIILVESQPLMYSSPFLIRKGFVSLLFLIQYAIANDPGFQAVYQEDSLAAPPLTLDNTSPVIFDPSQFTTPFTSGSASSQTSTDPSETYPDPQDGNNSENFLVSNEYCNNAGDANAKTRGTFATILLLAHPTD